VELADAVLSGDRRALARSITLVESRRPDHRRDADRLMEAVLDATGYAVRVGISGAPGVGKSTFIGALGVRVLELGHRVAVLAVDPSSTRSGGSILGDKTRMGPLAADPRAFVRPSPSGGDLGGVARRTREAMLLCEAAGFDVVLVETVGVGQSELAVGDMVDIFTLLVSPGGGDELQGIKRGIMELADLVVVNKADGALAPAARHACADHKRALQLLRRRHTSIEPTALLASAEEGMGIAEVWEELAARHEALTESGELAHLRASQNRAWLWSELTDSLTDRLRHDPAVRALLPEVEAAVIAGEMPPAAGAHQLLEAFGLRDGGS
jgi:LAO/AO transport system kinase